MWIQISSGKGPDECELGVSHFIKSYIKELNKKGIKTKITDTTDGNLAGNLKSALLTLELDGDCCDEDITRGTILWVCKSPYRPYHKRKNWFINVEVFNFCEELRFSPDDVRFETMRSSGPGGQNVNKVETAVRAIHIPTGLTVTAREERSQSMNKKLALCKLSRLIEDENNQSLSKTKKTIWEQHNELERGNAVRVYEGPDFVRKIV